MNVSVIVAASIIASGLFVTLALPIALWRAAAAAQLSRGLAAGVGPGLAVWFVATTTLAVVGAYRPSPGVVPPTAIALLIAIVGGTLAVRFVPGLAAVLGHSAAQPALIGVQFWRIEGAALLLLWAQGRLPTIFAVPAGIGDLLVGVTAPVVLLNLRHRKLAIAWNVFGLVNLIFAVAIGVTSNPGIVRWLCRSTATRSSPS